VRDSARVSNGACSAPQRILNHVESRCLQLGVLLRCQAQEYPASANLDCLVQRLPALQVGQPSAPLNQLDDLVRRREVKLPGQWCLQILLQELAVPAVAALERHVHTVPGILAGHGFSVGEYKAKNIHNPRCRGVSYWQ
jgi:hypothetical protein